MFVLYMLAEASRELEMPMRRRKIRLTTMYNNESVWMVPGTVGADD
jgi:hypothetical protein